MNAVEVATIIARYKQAARNDIELALMVDADAPIDAALLYVEGALYGHLSAMGMAEPAAEVVAHAFYEQTIGEWHRHIAAPLGCQSQALLH